MVGANQLDYAIVVSARSLARIVASCPKTPASGSLSIELRRRAGAGAIDTGSTTLVAGSALSVAGNNGLNFNSSAITPVAFAANDVLTLRITAESVNGFEDLRVDLYE
jgi:hypothetical protein